MANKPWLWIGLGLTAVLFDRYDSFDINKLPPPLDTWFNQINTIAIEILKHCDLPVGFFPRNPP